jgi:transposase-like protein
MILNALVEKLKRRSKDDFKGRHYEATLILQAVSWYLRYPLSYRDIEELFLERGLEVDHSTLNRWVLAYAPLIERRLRTFRKPHCGSIRVDETYVKSGVSGGICTGPSTSTARLWTSFSRRSATWRPPSASSARCCRRSRCSPLTGSALMARAPTHPLSRQPGKTGSWRAPPVHYVTKHLQQGIESDHFRVKRPMPRVGCFQAFHTARRTIQGFEAMLWLRKGFGFAGAWTVCEQNQLLALCFGLPQVNKV